MQRLVRIRLTPPFDEFAEKAMTHGRMSLGARVQKLLEKYANRPLNLEDEDLLDMLIENYADDPFAVGVPASGASYLDRRKEIKKTKNEAEYPLRLYNGRVL